MRISGVIFDLNGTVISDEDEWGEAFRKVLKTLGVDEKADYPHIGGIGIEENWPLFIKKYKIKTRKTVDELAVLTKAEYKKLIPRITLKPGFEDFCEELKELEIKIALATSSTWDSVEIVLETFSLIDTFDSITTGEEVLIKKPDPQIFEVAAEKLELPPEKLLVFEDSLAGIIAAKEAGMKAIGLFRNQDHKNELQQGAVRADSYIRDFTQINPKFVKLLKKGKGE